MSEIKLDKRSYYPKLALITYFNGSDSFLLKHFFVRKKNTYYATDGQTLSEEDAKSIFKEFQSRFELKDANVLNPSIVFFNNKVLIWHVSKTSYKLTFTKDTNIESGVYELPDHIFVLANGLSVFWIKEKGRNYLSNDTKLYNTFYPNVDNSCNVCMGNVNNNDANLSLNMKIEQYTELFFNSEFKILT